MLNKKNIYGWINLGLRIFLGLGLVFFIEKRYGGSSVHSWLVYITITAAINSTDGLLSQFFMREFISITKGNRGDKSNPYYDQKTLYLLISVLVSLIFIWVLSDDINYVFVNAFAICLFCIFKSNDSKFKAFVRIDKVQRYEIISNSILIVVLLGGSLVVQDMGLFILAHLSGMNLSLFLKSRIYSRESLFGISKSIAEGAPRKFQLSKAFLKTLQISSCGNLSINIALLILEGSMASGISGSFIFTYRVGALISEISSLPLVLRIPEITRSIAADKIGYALQKFSKNYRLSLGLCVLGMLCLIIFSNVWNRLLPLNLHVSTGFLLIFVACGWLLERVSTLMSQIFMSMQEYSIFRYYSIYPFIFWPGVMFAIYYDHEIIFPLIMTLSNAILGMCLTASWRKSYDKKTNVSALQS